MVIPRRRYLKIDFRLRHGTVPGPEDGEEVPLVEVDGSKTATYYGVEIVDVGERSWCLTSLFCGIRLWRSSSSSDDESLHSASKIRIEFSASWIQKEKWK